MMLVAVHCEFMPRLFRDVDLSHISIAEHRDPWTGQGLIFRFKGGFGV